MTSTTRWSAARVAALVSDLLLAFVLAVFTTLWTLAVCVAFGFEGDGAVQGGIFVVWLLGWGALRFVAMKRGWLTWGRRGAVAGVAVAYLIYLAWDESASPSIERNRLAVGEPYTDEATYRLTLRYTQRAPGGAKPFVEPPHRLDFNYKARKAKEGESRVKVERENVAARRDYLLRNRERITENWERLTEVRAWWVELGSHARLGDMPFASLDQPLITFKPAKVYMEHALAVAGLRAIDGHGDAALDLVGEVYRVGARLEADACTLVRGMIARVVQRQALEAGVFVLGTADVGWAARARFVKLLGEPVGGREGVRRLVLAEANFWSEGGLRQWLGAGVEGGGPAPWLKPFARLVTNPQATLNLLHETHERMAARAMERDAEGLAEAAKQATSLGVGGVAVKNLGGRLLVGMALPAYDSVVKSYWETEDLRNSVRARAE